MRLIDADNLKTDAQWEFFYNCYFAYSISQIDDAPTVQAVPIEELQEIRQEIEERINNCGDGTFKDGLCEAFDIVYCKIKELSE